MIQRRSTMPVMRATSAISPCLRAGCGGCLIQLRLKSSRLKSGNAVLGALQSAGVDAFGIDVGDDFIDRKSVV